MPDTFRYGAELLLRTSAISDSEWRQLLESRRLLLKKSLDKFSLKTLGDVECLSSESHQHEINWDNPEVVTHDGLGLDTQGIFGRGEAVFDQIKIPPAPWSGWGPSTETVGGTVNLWGLSRKGEWIVAQVEFRKESGYKGRGYDRAVKVTIRKTTVDELAEVAGSTQSVWDLLGRTVAEWTDQRLRIYLQANELLTVVQAQDSAARQIGYSEEVVES
ncbi:MAG: hypothetical protein Q7R60_01320 [bacterium]|nr:hypothetical protein [bacterium]